MEYVVGIVIALFVVGGVVYKYKPEWIEVVKSYIGKQYATNRFRTKTSPYD